MTLTGVLNFTTCLMCHNHTYDSDLNMFLNKLIDSVFHLLLFIHLMWSLFGFASG